MRLMGVVFTLSAGVVFLVSDGLCDQPSGDPAVVLARARDKFLRSIGKLPNYTCIQTIDRRYFRRAKPLDPRQSCDELIGARIQRSYSRVLEATDRLRLDVKVSEGFEIGSWAGASRFDPENFLDLVRGGPFATGAFGTSLGDIFASGREFDYAGREKGFNEYQFQIPADSSHHYVHSGRDWIITSYRGSVWIDPISFDPKRLSVRAELPGESDGCEERADIDYGAVPMRTGNLLVPDQNTFYFLMKDGTETEITVGYSGCREFLGQSQITFDAASVAGERPEREVRPAPLPAGLPVSLAFASAVDTDIAAAGDAVSFKVLKPVRDKATKQVIIRDGATARGRIVEMRHWLGSPRCFVISVLLETIEDSGSVHPFHALREAADGASRLRFARGNVPIWVQPPMSELNVSPFVFLTNKNRHVIRAGYQSTWMTVPPPQ